MTDKSPVFVKIDKYRELLDVVDVLQKQVDDVKGTLKDIRDLKDEEESELRAWEDGIAEVEEKIGFIDKSLFEPEQ
jgi:peptidoglycan hydrolase CwlO-like protein